MARKRHTPDEVIGKLRRRASSARQPANLPEQFLIGGMRVHDGRQRARVPGESLCQEAVAEDPGADHGPAGGVQSASAAQRPGLTTARRPRAFG
jgi:hypothetical protein